MIKWLNLSFPGCLSFPSPHHPFATYLGLPCRLGFQRGHSLIYPTRAFSTLPRITTGEREESGSIRLLREGSPSPVFQRKDGDRLPVTVGSHSHEQHATFKQKSKLSVIFAPVSTTSAPPVAF